MKKRRFLSLFFVFLILLTSALSPAALAAEEDGEEPEPIPDIQVEAKAALLIDPTTDEILYELNIHEQLYPASLTKVMTALLTLEAIEAGHLTMDQVLTASASAVDLPYDASTAGMEEGEQMTVEQLLYCILVVSAADACNVLAEAVSGSIDAFVERMNQRAQELGCQDTHFANPHGYHDDQHYSTASDPYLITRVRRDDNPHQAGRAQNRIGARFADAYDRLGCGKRCVVVSVGLETNNGRAIRRNALRPIVGMRDRRTNGKRKQGG